MKRSNEKGMKMKQFSKTVAREIMAQMSDDDKASFMPCEHWKAHIKAMCPNGTDIDEVMRYLEAHICPLCGTEAPEIYAAEEEPSWDCQTCREDEDEDEAAE
jgi:hypothetical protein